MKFTLIFGLIAAFSISVLAHGEDKPGPHGGHIKMPANFHTELVADADGSFRIYLLDMQFQNPTVKNSAVTVSVSGKKKNTIKCAAMGNDHFHCFPDKPVKSGTLVIKATRDSTTASMDAKYKLPLKKFETSTPAVDHSKHH